LAACQCFGAIFFDPHLIDREEARSIDHEVTAERWRRLNALEQRQRGFTLIRGKRGDIHQANYDLAGSKDKTLKLYDGHFHDLLNDIDKDVVMADMKTWIAAHLRG
jgi:hypothetical protein